MAPSATVSQTYTLADRSLAGFTSNLPLVIINTFGQQISGRETVAVRSGSLNPGRRAARSRAAGSFDGRCELKIRGYSSLRFPKRSYTVKYATTQARPWMQRSWGCQKMRVGPLCALFGQDLIARRARL